MHDSNWGGMQSGSSVATPQQSGHVSLWRAPHLTNKTCPPQLLYTRKSQISLNMRLPLVHIPSISQSTTQTVPWLAYYSVLSRALYILEMNNYCFTLCSLAGVFSRYKPFLQKDKTFAKLVISNKVYTHYRRHCSVFNFKTPLLQNATFSS